MSIDNTARAEELLRHFLEVDRKFRALKKLHPRSSWEGLDENTKPQYVRQIGALMEERERSIHELRQWGYSLEDLEKLSAEMGQQEDASRFRELRQIAGAGPSLPASKTASGPDASVSSVVSAAKPPKLTPRELRIWEVIKRGLEGPAYCRELHDANLRPRASWIKKDCPGTYPAAYVDLYWRQMIQDEKSKVRRKAQLAFC